MKGFSFLSASIAVIVIIVSGIIVVNVMSPTIDQGKSYQKINEAKQTLTSIDKIVREVAVEAPGSRRSLNVEITDGQLEISPSDDKIKIKLRDTQILESQTRAIEGNIIISTGGSIDATEKDADNDGFTDLVLEDEYLMFAINKTGNSTNPIFINTTNFIRLIRNKRLDINATPTTGIFIDGMLNTSYGTGYTELTKKGTGISSSSIRLYMNSTANITYDAIFTLSADLDFIELEIKKR